MDGALIADIIMLAAVLLAILRGVEKLTGRIVLRIRRRTEQRRGTPVMGSKHSAEACFQELERSGVD